MPHHRVHILSIVGFCLISFLPAVRAQNPGDVPPANRERLLMDFGWRFALGNANDQKADFGFGTFWPWLAKQNIQTGALGADFDDSKWRTVDLPHDWGMELPVQKNAQPQWGSRPLGRNFPETSIGWYRKTFTIPESDRGRRFTLEFEGVCHDCVVEVNGIYVGSHFSGYTSFSFDITDMVRYGAKNVVVVRVDGRENEGWWYQGAGIYRHVWLTKTAPVHVPVWGTQVISTVNGTNAQVTAKTRIANDSDQAVDVVVQSNIVDDAGQTVGTDTQPAQHVEPGAEVEIAPSLAVANPKLWSLDAPHLYKLVTSLQIGGKETDHFETTFGIRTIQFDPDRGFLLNGQVVKIQGLCDHQQHAGVGVGVPDSLWDYHIKKMKEIGCNAVRMSTNAPPPAFLDACDRLGMLVMDDNRVFSSGPEGLDQVGSLVRRDRNHPSVIIWLAGNEEYGFQSLETGGTIMKTIQNRFHQLDPTRPVTFAASNGGATTGINSVADVRGINYLVLFDVANQLPNDKKMPHDLTPELYHQNHPKQPIIGTEETGQVSEPVKPGKPQGRVTWWNFIKSHDWYSGAFIWSGFDYYGEAAWPNVVSPYGVIDLCGFPRDGYWYYRKEWSGKDDEPKPVIAKAAATVQLEPDRPSIAADGEDVDVVNVNIVDADGHLVTTADNPLTFSVSGPGRIVGVGSGNEASHEPDQGNKRNTWHGHAQVLIRSTGNAGTIQVTVHAKGLASPPVSITAATGMPVPRVP